MHRICAHSWLDHLTAEPDPQDPIAAAFAEVGIDITRELPRPVDRGTFRRGDVAVGIGCGASCPEPRRTQVALLV